jgi:hypothetical protein
MGVFVRRGLPALTGGAQCKTYQRCALGWDLRLTQTKSSIEGTLPGEDRQPPHTVAARRTRRHAQGQYLQRCY